MPKQIAPLIFLAFFLVFTKNVYAAFDFTIDKSQITDTEELEVKVNLDLSTTTAGRTYFLRGAFFTEGTTSYFGYTINNSGDQFNGPYSACQELYSVTVDENGDWSGSFKVKVDSESNSFKGTENYLFKVGRYTNSCNSITWVDNKPVPVTITKTTPVTSTPTSSSQSSTSTSSKSKSPSPSPKSSPTSTSSKKTTSVLGSSQSAEITASSASGISLSVSPTPSAEPKADKSSKKIKIAGAVAGSGAIVMGLSAGLYLWYKRKLTSGNKDKGST